MHIQAKQGRGEFLRLNGSFHPEYDKLVQWDLLKDSREPGSVGF